MLTIKHKSTILAGLCLAAASFLAIAAVTAENDVFQLYPQTDTPVAEQNAAGGDETPELWFVELQSGPTADGTSLTSVRNEKAAFRANAKKANVKFAERYAYDTLFNGLSIKIDRSQIAALTRLPGVKNIYPVIKVTTAQADSSAPDLASAIQMTGADIAQNSLGLNGSGIKVGVIDTGFDLDHADLGGDGTAGAPHANSRVVAQHDFVGDAYNNDSASPSFNPVPAPDPIADDCNGHGTHVAGIVGANGAVKGVAPNVSFGAYRVFGCAGSTDADIMIAAMERALADGMQVVNMSIGSAFQWPQYPTAQAGDRLVNKGVIVVCSIGNSGANGLYSASAPGVGSKVIGVASIDNNFVTLPAFTVSPDNMPIGYTAASGAPAAPTSGSLPMDRTGTTTSTADACNAPIAANMTGKAVLIRRGTCGFYEKARRAQVAGASAVVLYNNAAGFVTPNVAPVAGIVDGQPVTIPVVMVTQSKGALLNGRIAGGPTTMTWTATTATEANPTGGLISSFSSYGLSPDLTSKPNISAPGGSIYSTYPLESGGYASISGTSMASPHVAGAAALLLQARPSTSSQDVGRIFQNSADPTVWFGNPGLGFLENVHRQGAGMLDVDDAILATTSIAPGSLALGESQAGPATRTLTLTNTSATAVTYDVSHQSALATGPNTFVPAFFNAPATMTPSSSSVVVPANGTASLNVTITANAGLADKSMYGGYVRFTPQGGGAALRVPYSGFKGDYQSIQVLTPTANGFPWLAKLNAAGTTFSNQPSGASYTMAGNDIPFILAHFDHQSRRVRLEVKDAVSGKSWHRAYDLDYFGRNSTATGFFDFPWDGMTTAGNKIHTVPNGQYVITMTVFKALGNDSDVETWTSPVITIARP
jgi:subtilisin family serine protease